MSQANDDYPPEEAAEAPGGDEAEREIAGLRAEVAALKDRALRSLAEVENVRKRLERERDDAAAYSIARFARDMLTVADNLNRALASLPAHIRADESLKAVLEGVEATERELKAALARHGVKVIETENQRFNPNLHQAIAEVPAQGAEPGTVINVVQQGYMIGERLLRPAMVTVAKAEATKSDERPAANGSGGRFDRTV